MKEFKNDSDKLKELFEREIVVVPESLRPENIIKKLPDSKIKPMQRAKAITWVACAAVLMIFSISVVTHSLIGGSDSSNVASQANDYSKLFNVLADYSKIQKKQSEETGYFGKSAYDVATEDSFSALFAKAGYAGNNKIEGVQVADIAKTDGKYIYTIEKNKKDKIKIIKVDKGALSAMPSIKLKKDETARELLLSEDRLVVIASTKDKSLQESNYNSAGEYYNSFYDVNYGYYDEDTAVYIYDVKESGKPKLLNGFVQDGAYKTARMVNGYMTLVTNDHKSVNSKQQGDIDKYVPGITFEDGKKQYVNAKDIIVPETIKLNTFIVVSGVNVSSNSMKINTGCIVGCSSEVYITKDNLYSFTTIYGEQSASVQINRFSIKNANVTHEAQGIVSGLMQNKFSVDEYNGYLRVATSYYKKSILENAVTVLNMSLEKVSEIKGIAPLTNGEEPFYANFNGDVVYFATATGKKHYYTVSLSDPKNPKSLGVCIANGFSSVMHNLKDNKALCYGRDSNGNILLTLFDVTDKKSPKRLDSIIFNRPNDIGDTSSSIIMGDNDQNVFNNISYIEETGALLIPYMYYNKGGKKNSYIDGVAVVKIKDGRVKLSKGLEDYKITSIVLKTIKIENTVYSIGTSGIVSYDLTSFDLIDKIKY